MTPGGGPGAKPTGCARTKSRGIEPFEVTGHDQREGVPPDERRSEVEEDVGLGAYPLRNVGFGGVPPGERRCLKTVHGYMSPALSSYQHVYVPGGVPYRYMETR